MMKRSLNLDAKEHWKSIKQKLARRGLKPIMDADEHGYTEWETYGPSPKMNYMVYVGPACKVEDEDQYFDVAIYPRSVYYGSVADWKKKGSDNRIFTK